MVWNGVPEIVCEGSPYDIGLAHGRGARDRIFRAIELYTTLFGETASIGWEEARNRAQVFKPTIQQLAPDLYEEMRGIAQGADLDLDDVLALNIRSEISLTNYSDGCTSIAKVDSQSVLLAQNWDWVEEAGDVTVLLDIRAPNKPRILMSGEAGIVGKFGMNDAGVGVCMNAIKCGVLDTGKLPVHVAMRLVLESPSFDAAKAELDALGLASCVNFMIADKAGNFATVECTPRGNAVIAPEAGSGTVCHTNHIYSPDIPAGIRDFPSENSFSRLARIRELSDGKPGSVDSIREWLSDEEGAPAAICRSRPPTARGIERMVTLATVITDLKKLEMQVSYGKPNQNPPIKTLVF